MGILISGRKCARGWLKGFAPGHIESNLRSFPLRPGQGDNVCLWVGWWRSGWDAQEYKPRMREVPTEPLAIPQCSRARSCSPASISNCALSQPPALLTLPEHFWINALKGEQRHEELITNAEPPLHTQALGEAIRLCFLFLQHPEEGSTTAAPALQWEIDLKMVGLGLKSQSWQMTSGLLGSKAWTTRHYVEVNTCANGLWPLWPWANPKPFWKGPGHSGVCSSDRGASQFPPTDLTFYEAALSLSTGSPSTVREHLPIPYWIQLSLGPWRPNLRIWVILKPEVSYVVTAEETKQPLKNLSIMWPGEVLRNQAK